MARKLIVEIVGDTSSLERSFKRAEKTSQSFGSKVAGVGKSLAKGGIFVGATAGVVGLTAALKVGIDEFSEAQKVTAQTEAALRSTKGAANVTARQIDELASSIQKYSGADDEAVQSAENLLLTFTNIRNEVGKGNDVFAQATRTIVDMSQAMDQDLSTSAIQVGKALNDPVKGLGALARVGVTFTDKQKKLVKQLVATDNRLAAQKIILAELNKEFGGSAKAFGETLPGQIKILQGALSNLAGEIVTAFAPEVEKVIKQFNRWIANSENQERVLKDVKAIVEGLATSMEVLAKATEVTYRGFERLVAAGDKLGGAAFAVASQIPGLTPGQISFERAVELKELERRNRQAARQRAARPAARAERPIVVENRIILDGRDITDAVNRRNARNARRVTNQTSGRRDG